MTPKTDDINVLREHVTDLISAYDTVIKCSGYDNLSNCCKRDYAALEEIDCCISPYADDSTSVTMQEALESVMNSLKELTRGVADRGFYDSSVDTRLGDAKLARRIYKFLRRNIKSEIMDEHPQLEEYYRKALKIQNELEALD